ncbi:MAG: asparagine synthase (glutamine-hydrolyzing) [Nitrospira sp.]|jgi:asparagine synthase (glutamine-hydrolysing)|nr:asparagine synthase (glutamine-hydrolyzing) [Nitrospira sp.]
MCGIAGILNLDGRPFVDEAQLHRMGDCIVHRGPDGHGHFTRGPVGLVHRRLSIIDLSTGAQPMFNEDASIVVVFNGEIYNHLELRSILESRGHTFRTHSDTEVILHAYEEYGLSFPTHLTGMFAFALWDMKQQRLVLTRDRVGIKPLYYTVHNGQLLFASEIKALLTERGVPRRIDYDALQAYLRVRYVPAPKTMFQGIYKLLPGHQLVAQDGQICTDQYWDLTFSDEPLTERQCLDDLETLFAEVCQQHLMSEVPFGVFLSGGLDSSAVVATMRKLLKTDPLTFTVGYSGSDGINEFDYSRLVSKHIGTSHHEVILSPQQFSDWIPTLTWHLDEPVGDSACVPLFFLAQRAKQHATVLHSGEGADEILGGYSIYKKMLLMNRLHSSPVGSIARLFDWSVSGASFGGKAGRYVRHIAMPLQDRYRGVSSLFLDGIKTQVVNPELRTVSTKGSFLEDTFRMYYQRVRSATDLNQMLYVDTKTWLPDDLLVKADKMTMAASIELRVPFLDHRMIEFAAKLPIGLKIKNGETKYLLKKVMEPYLPKAVIYRPKKGFPVPIRQWFQQGLAQMARDIVLNKQNTVSQFINVRVAGAMLHAHQNGQIDAADELWALVVLEQWCRTFEVSA